MLLQTDPTVIFALKKAGRWDGNLRREDLMLDSPYNTYRRAGLPPGRSPAQGASRSWPCWTRPRPGTSIS